MYRAHVLVCGGTGCTSSNSLKIIERFEQLVAQNGLSQEVKVVRTGCFGLCERGPIVIVYPEGAFYSRIKPEDVDRIVQEHLLKGRIVKDSSITIKKTGRCTKPPFPISAFIKSSTAWLCATAALSTRKTSMNT